ncbi:MAG: hypothetical protein GY941_22000 [Planctomycetes bacterium]|nr:hypothetical protein [Planctomycetota bacterium]
MEFLSFGKIGQFRQTVKNIRHQAQFQGVDEDDNPIMDRTVEFPTVRFTGTVKLHGTNAAVSFDEDGTVGFQSRKRMITPQADNMGFAFFADAQMDTFKYLEEIIRRSYPLGTVTIFGEWCGGNIQKGVAISGLEKMFVIFDVQVDGESLHRYDWEGLTAPDDSIFNINQFPHYPIDIDFNKPELAQNNMITMVEEVEAECPVGKQFGRVVGSDNTTGEGIVFVGEYKGNRHIFKVKGKEHSATKVKTLANVDVEKIASVEAFVEYSVTEARLQQGLEQLGKDFTVKQTGEFLRWLINDIIVEEKDTLVENGLEPKDVNREISKAARVWFMKALDN